MSTPAADAGTPATHVVVVDDEPHLLRALTMNLAGRGYQVSPATSGRGALDLVGALRPDLLILDLGLPDIDGMEVIRRIRAVEQAMPILVLSARSASVEKVEALDLGATDYVTKPFDMAELIARVRAATRRVRPADPQPVVTLGAAVVDLAARIVRRTDGSKDMSDDTAGEAGGVVHLTPTEWRMLDALLRRPGVLLTTRELLTAMRGDPEHTDASYLRIYMQQLRRKLEADPSRPRHLLTEPGLGYRYLP